MFLLQHFWTKFLLSIVYFFSRMKESFAENRIDATKCFQTDRHGLEAKVSLREDGVAQRVRDSRRQGVGGGMAGRNARMPKRGKNCQAAHRHGPSVEERQRLAPSSQGHVKKDPLSTSIHLCVQPSIYPSLCPFFSPHDTSSFWYIRTEKGFIWKK